jgi:hypothetical protein
MHLDIDVTDFTAAEARGARARARNRPVTCTGAKEPWRTYFDPAGHPFCLVTV